MESGRSACTRLLAHDPVTIPIAHVAIRRMGPRHWGNPVPARLRTRDPAVSVVVVAGERIVPGDPAGGARRA